MAAARNGIRAVDPDVRRRGRGGHGSARGGGPADRQPEDAVHRGTREPDQVVRTNPATRSSSGMSASERWPSSSAIARLDKGRRRAGPCVAGRLGFPPEVS